MRAILFALMLVACSEQAFPSPGHPARETCQSDEDCGGSFNRCAFTPDQDCTTTPVFGKCIIPPDDPPAYTGLCGCDGLPIRTIAEHQGLDGGTVVDYLERPRAACRDGGVP